MEDKIILERIYNAPIGVVWKAITDKAQLKKWYFDFSEDFKAEVGHQFEWNAGPPDGKQWLHHAKVEEVIPGRKFVHTWEYPGYTGTSVVSWELIPVDEYKTKLIFTHHFIVPFDPAEEALRRGNFVEGWNAMINKGLVEFLEKEMALFKTT
ncbi:MAG TPA: SRPBCC domain-containing protein [Bacteroidia bacterium]|jgi:uncharacterized protein YndB with AHSA1/START domain|nr:SRPBCC domain-containing protein [Bacteroidia bacterium]